MKTKYNVGDTVTYSFKGNNITGVIFAIRVGNNKSHFTKNKYLYLVSNSNYRAINDQLRYSKYHTHFTIQHQLTTSDYVCYSPLSKDNSNIRCSWIIEELIIDRTLKQPSEAKAPIYGDTCKRCNTYNKYIETTGNYICYSCLH